MSNYFISVSKVINKHVKQITSSYTFEEPERFTIFIPAFAYYDTYNEIQEERHVLLRGQKDKTFNTLAVWFGEFTKNGQKILYSDDQLMAAAILAIVNKNRVYIMKQINYSMIYKIYRFNYCLTQQQLSIHFNKTKDPCDLEELSIDLFNRNDVDNFEDFFTQIRIANLIYNYLNKQLRRHPHKLLSDIIKDDKILEQSLKLVDSGCCKQYRCRSRK